MPHPETESQTLERQVALDRVGGVAAALARGLGAIGVGGGAMAAHLERSLTAECPLCGIVVSSVDLLAAGAPAVSEAELTDKQRRLRLGYCARNTCAAKVYRLRFTPSPDVDWEKVWSACEPGLVGAVPETETAPRLSFGAALMAALRPLGSRFSRRQLIGGVTVLLLALGWKAGVRVPGLSKTPRVFIVPGSPPANSKPTGR